MRARILSLILLLILGGCAAQGITPKEAIALHDQADTFYANGDCSSARVAYEKLVKRFPQEAGFHLRIGNCHALELNYDQAVAAYEQALALDPRSSRAWYNLAYVRAQMLAETVIRMHERLDPADPNVQQMRRLVADILAPFDQHLSLPEVETKAEANGDTEAQAKAPAPQEVAPSIPDGVGDDQMEEESGVAP